jgi:hypothetical protein
MGKNAAKSKTLWVNVIMIVAGALGGIAGTEVIQQNPQIAGYFVSIMGVVNVILRLMTKEPIK